ncbi:tyrosine-type recombinase/integrase [Flavobacterium psychraquaticum]|uniref:tyrosine-type recombinase/integrase n=1 Tax=Flavobacterium psychraquaticum TaxID=3103958 RepID=UPI002ACDA328|nr:phage integrase SAM-like domain-containing protein [Flavobacterium sp. LB-N7T]
MANVKFRAMGKNDPVNLNVRFYHNKIDCSAKTNIFISPNDWSNKTFKVKQNANEALKIDLENKTSEIRDLILGQFRIDYPKGILIDKNWLVTIINKINDKPVDGFDETLYFLDFLSNYIEQSKSRINPRTGELISSKTIQNYTTTLKRLQEFEDLKGSKLRTKEINLDFHNKFTSFLKIEGNYSNTLIEKYISQIKGFVKEAKVLGYEVSSEVESKNFTFKREETLDTYLNLNEINEIFKLDLSEKSYLMDARDLLIFGVWTGLRVSDIKRVNEFNISENRIRIIATEKTKSTVEIPIHAQLKEVLKRRNNTLPIITDQNFNKNIKLICQLAKIDEVILGSVKDPETKRKVRGYYEKYKLISSHTCRRSFVSNHYGKIDDRTIMAITTHKSYTQYMKYVKTTLSEHAQNLEDYWNNKQ